MASYTPTLGTPFIGSIGGTTFSHNKGGPYARLRVIPTNPNTQRQQIVKAFLSAVATAWSNTLTQAQRDAWDLYAANVARPKKGGGSQFLTGIDHFIRSNVPRGVAGQGFVLAGPTLFDVGTYTAPSFAIELVGQTIDVTFDNTDAWANEDLAGMQIYTGRPQSVGIRFFKGPFQFTGTVPGNATTPPASPLSMSVPFPVVTGQRVWARAQVSRADGRLSDAVILEATVP